MALYDSENNRLLDTNDNVLHARATFTVGTREVKKIYVGENEVKAIYIGDNLVYEKEPEIVVPQLDAPVISLSEDILSIEEVENAEYYDIYVDGVLAESVPVVSGYSGDILTEKKSGFRTTYIKFDTPPANANDYDSCVQSGWGTIEGLTSYSNKTKVYVWGDNGSIKINNVEISGGSTYDTAVEVVLTGDYDIYLIYGRIH